MENFMREVLLSEKSFRRGIVRPEILTRLVDEHTKGVRDHAPQLWAFLMLELWFNKFID
jgi:asparagine synthase (glutamine-hydrolysing)